MVDEVIRLENLGMSYGRKEVLKNINLAIHEGEIFALIGPSGVGKTTLLRIMNFFETPTRGSLVFKGVQVKHGTSGEKNTLRRRMSMLFQVPAVFNTTVFNNVAYGLRIRNMGRNMIERNVRDALSIVGLEGEENQKARTLSGGEAQRLAFARAIVFDPEVLFLDEPTANLDPANVAKIEEIIKHIREEHRTTIVIATHNIPQVRRIADRVGILLDGKLIEVNTREKIFSHPDDPRSSAFINGEMIY